MSQESGFGFNDVPACDEISDWAQNPRQETK